MPPFPPAQRHTPSYLTTKHSVEPKNHGDPDKELGEAGGALTLSYTKGDRLTGEPVGRWPTKRADTIETADDAGGAAATGQTNVVASANNEVNIPGGTIWDVLPV